MADNNGLLIFDDLPIRIGSQRALKAVHRRRASADGALPIRIGSQRALKVKQEIERLRAEKAFQSGSARREH